MEILGFVLFLIGAGGMDSTGKGYVITVTFVLIGLFLMYFGGVITDTFTKERKKRRHERTGEI